MNNLEFISKFHAQKLSPQALQEFDQRIQNDEAFAKLYTEFLMDESLMKDALNELSITGHEPSEPKPSKKSFYLITSTLMAAAALFVFFFMNPLQQNPDFLPKLISVTSNPQFQIGQKLQLGKFYKISEGELLRIEYPDKSILEFKDECEFSFSRKANSKLIHLTKGHMYGDIQKQLLGSMLIETSSAKAKILGTRFNLSCQDQESILEVLHGKIHFQNRTGSDDMVRSGERAVASPKQAVIAESTEPKPIDHTLERFNRWKTYSHNLQKDPELVLYYDHFKGEYPYILKNLAKGYSPHLRDGRITDPQWTKGRWPQKNALYYSSYSYVDCGNDSYFDFQEQITLFAWVKVKKFTRDFQAIIARGDNSWRIARNGDQNSIEFACSSNLPYLIRGKTAIDDNQWHLITATYDGEHMKLYIDGEIDTVKEVKGSLNVTPETRVDIGTNNEASHRGFEGWMDEVGIFKRALSEAEIHEMYAIGKPE